MLKKILFILFSVLALMSCDKEKVHSESPVEKTTIMFFPWSTNLKTCFLQNINDFHQLIRNNRLNNERVMVCMETSPGEASIMEIKEEKIVDVMTYKDPSFTTVEGISNFLNLIHKNAPAKKYSMIVGCHGTAWLPAVETSTRCSFSDESEVPLTRYFGGTTKEYQIEIPVFREGIQNSMIPKFEYILFDDCYMANIEVAYELKDVCNHIVASPTEIMAYGFPYHLCGNYLIGAVNYENVCNEFYKFYSKYSIPCGTIAVVDCSEIGKLASIMKEINSYSAELDTLDSPIQRMDGYVPTLFYDFGDYVDHLVISDSLKHEFGNQLSKVVPYKRRTESYFSTFEGVIPIKSYSGVTTSFPSNHPLAAKIVNTSWYRDTH
ncbi:MAG: clostripain-related cysteine peptidase [Paludibacteraceae bacterium]|nr:clostripain-related cysteine peptidase [Paludibacteraceae bacterium]